MIFGKAVKFGNNVDTDVILPGKYLVLTLNSEKLAEHAMEGLDPNFAERVKGETVLVGGKNFGCGSSREEAPTALKYAGVRCVIAESFARIFYRNSINIGLPVLECPGVSAIVEEGDELEIDLNVGKIRDVSKNKTLQCAKLPEFVLDILGAGGLIEHIKKRC